MTVITDYLYQVEPEHQTRATELYQLLKQLLPNAEEKLSYQMPTFYQKHNLVHFAAAKKHLGLYPTPAPIEHFAEELSHYQTSKGAIQLPYDELLPVELITKIVEFQKQANKIE